MTTQPDNRPTEEVLRDLQRNFELRRLLLVALHVLVPAFIVTGVKMATQSVPAPGLDMLWEQSLALAACGVVISSAMVAHGMIRCQHGIVVNGALVNWRIYGKPVPKKLNFRGVSTGFYALAVLSLLFGLSIVVYAGVARVFDIAGWWLLAVVAIVCLMLAGFACWWLTSRHRVAWQFGTAMLAVEQESSRRDETWRQLHRMNSLDDTNSDIGVVFVTAMVLFSTMLTTLPDLADIESALFTDQIAVVVGWIGNEVVAVYAILVMFLSQSMIIRLRVAMAEHISQSDASRSSGDVQVWKPGSFERTSMLYLMLAIMLNIFAMMLCIKLLGSIVIASGFALVYLIHSRIYYGLVLRKERGIYERYWQSDGG